MTWLRDSLRSLRRAPGYSALTIVTLAVALGIATVVFASVNAIRWPISPYRDSERLYDLRTTGDGLRGDVRAIDRLRAAQGFLPAIEAIAFAQRELALVETARTIGEHVSMRVGPEFFTLTGAVPGSGRFFTMADTARHDHNLAIASDGFWRRDLLGASVRRGLTVTVDGGAHTVIGVAPPGMDGADLWLLAPSGWFERSPVNAPVFGFARVQAGVTRARLEADLRGVSRQLDAMHGRGKDPFRIHAWPIESNALPLSELHLALILAAGAILVIACANTANLALCRARSRESVFALQCALGATRWRIARDVLGECVVLALVAGALGGLIVLSSVGLIRRMIPVDVPLIGALDVHVNWVAFVFTLGAALLAALAFGLAPALRAAKADLTTPLKESSGATTARHGWRHSAFVAMEVALALAMVTSSGLLLRASRRVATIDYGYDRRGLVQAEVYLPRNTDTTDAARLIASMGNGIARLADVRAATWWGLARDAGLSVRGATSEGTRSALYNPSVRSVGPGYLATLGIPLLGGRDFLAGDASGPGVAVVDERAARELWPSEEAIGRQLLLVSRRGEGTWVTVIGVAKRVRAEASTLDAFDISRVAIYVSTPPLPGSRTFVVRTPELRESHTLSQISGVLRDAGPPGTYTHVSAYRDETTRLTDAHRFLSGTFTGLALCALALSIVGLFSVLSYTVITRTREYALRMALGGSPRSIMRLVIHGAAVLVLAGTAMGAFVAFLVARFVDPFLYDLYRVDPLTLIAAEAIVLLCSAAACVVPAVRAMRATPLEILRAS